MAKKLKIFLIIFISSTYISIAGSAGKNYTYETQNIVCFPTAGLLAHKSQLISIETFGNSGLMLAAEYSPFANVSFGLSFGGVNFLGTGEIDFQKYPGVTAKYRFLNEKKYLPAMAIGFSSQGRGIFDAKANSFQVLSPGFYLSASKSFKWDYGYFAIHTGVNYSLELVPESRRPNLFVGLEHSLSSKTSLNIEYDLNTPHYQDYVMTKGVTSLALRYSIEKNSTIEFDLVDIFGTHGKTQRYFTIEFTGYLF